VSNTWHSFMLPITERAYSFPMTTPWDSMNRLELYYANPSAEQPKGDHIRLRHVYLRSTSTHSPDAGLGLPAAAPPRKSCRDLSPVVVPPPARAQPSAAEAATSAEPGRARSPVPGRDSGGDGGGADTVAAAAREVAGGDRRGAWPVAGRAVPKLGVAGARATQAGAEALGTRVGEGDASASVGASPPPNAWGWPGLVLVGCCAFAAAACAVAAVLASVGLQARGTAGVSSPHRLTLLGVALRQTLLWLGSGEARKRRDLGL
jgi:hypothetical protein